MRVYRDNNELNDEFRDYTLLHFSSNAKPYIKRVTYLRRKKNGDDSQEITCSYLEFFDFEINISIIERFSRTLKILKVEFYNDFFDLFYNTFLFGKEPLVSPKLAKALTSHGVSGISFEPGPSVVKVH
jgi:hypothetical protein